MFIKIYNCSLITNVKLSDNRHFLVKGNLGNIQKDMPTRKTLVRGGTQRIYWGGGGYLKLGYLFTITTNFLRLKTVI